MQRVFYAFIYFVQIKFVKNIPSYLLWSKRKRELLFLVPSQTEDVIPRPSRNLRLSRNLQLIRPTLLRSCCNRRSRSLLPLARSAAPTRSTNQRLDQAYWTVSAVVAAGLHYAPR